MLTKEEVLQSIKELAVQKSIKREEILNAFDESVAMGESIQNKKIKITDILYYIGGAIVFLGIVIFVTQNWKILSTSTKILSTLGSSVATYFVAIFFGMKKKTESVSLAFHLIAALVMPIGLYVTFYEAGFSISGSGMQSLISGILFVVYLLSFAISRKNIFILFSVIFGTWLFFSLTSYMVGGNPIWDYNFYYYRLLAVGLAYIFLGYYFSQSERSSLSGFLYGFGILGFLSAALILGGWSPHQKAFWEISFPGLVFATLFLSVYLKSKSFLVFGTIFLMLYIIKITSEYFSGSLGWPLSLVIIGLLLICSGYLFVYIKNKFMSKTV